MVTAAAFIIVGAMAGLILGVLVMVVVGVMAEVRRQEVTEAPRSDWPRHHPGIAD